MLNGDKRCNIHHAMVTMIRKRVINHVINRRLHQDALLFKFSLNIKENWQKAEYGQWYPCHFCIVCRLSWGRSRPGSGSLRPESGSQRPISWSQRQGFQFLRSGFGPLRLGFRSFRPAPRSWRSESGSQRSGSGSLRLGCGFLEPESKFKGPRW